jgi:cellulose synthase operon protein C
MPTLNVKLFLRLLAVLIAIGGTLTGLYFYQVDRIPEALLWQANNAVEKGKADKAMGFMRQYLEFRPDDYDQAVKLGDMILERSRNYKDLNNAQFLFERVLRESPDRPDVARKLVGLCIRMNRPGDALIHAERLLKQTPNDGDLLAQIGECQLAQAKYDEAFKSLDAAILYAPANVRAHAQRANLMFKHLNKPEEAKAAVDQMIRLNSTKPEAFLIRARFYRNENRFDECLADLDSIFKIEADHLEGLLLSAEVHQQKGELRRAKETLRRVIALAPRDVRGYRTLSWLEVVSGNPAEAVAVLEKGASLLPAEPELLTPLADMWIQDGNTDKVQETIKKLEGKKSLPQANYLRARLMMRQGQWNEALSTLEALRTEAVGNTYLAAQLNLLIASCHERRGDFDSQIEALKRVFTFDPANLGARIALANANLDAGRFDEAMKDYAQAAKSPLAGLGVKTTHLSLAMRQARNANAPAETWTKLEADVQALSRQHPNVPDPVMLAAELASLRGDAEKGRAILQQACQKRPDDPRLWSALAAQVARFEGTIPAMRILGEAQLATGDSVDLRLARARLWADDFRAGRADRLQTLEELPANACNSSATTPV